MASSQKVSAHSKDSDLTASDRAMVFYDGECPLCRGLVAWCRERMIEKDLDFLPLQGELAKGLAGGHSLAKGRGGLTTLVFMHQGIIATHSDAVFHLAEHLRPPWQWLRWLRIVPRPLRDVAYRWIAHRRHVLSLWLGSS